MRNQLSYRYQVIMVAVLATSLTSLFSIAESVVVRGTFDNWSQVGPSTETANPYVTSAVQAAPTPSTDGAIVISEASVGHTFGIHTTTPEYAAERYAAIRSLLYPPIGATRVQVENGRTAFRYLTLLYGAETGENDVTTLFKEMPTWYGDDERTKVTNAITQLKAALANAPLDSGLRNLLLDAYTDRAVAEMQFIKNDLETLGKLRLGLEVSSPFVIDDEIMLLVTIEGKLRAAIDGYKDLFTDRDYGFEPSDLDASAVPGTPFGYYIFQREQPKRNQMRSRFFTASGDLEYVPGYDEDTEATVPNPTDQAVIGHGYRDFTTLLTLISSHVETVGSLNQLRGLRQNTGDLMTAREKVSKVLTETPAELDLLRAMFPNNRVTVLPQQGLVAYWNFEDEARNTQGTPAYDGELINGPQFSSQSPVAGQYLRCYGVNDYVDVDTEADPLLADFDADYTISAWFRAKSAPSGSERFQVYQSGDFILSLDLREGFPTSNTSIRVLTNPITSSVDIEVPDSEILGEWTHVATTYSNNGVTRKLEVYLNGSLAETISVAAPPSSSPNDFHIGADRNSFAGRFFDGDIDEVALWERALQPAEIEEIALTSEPFPDSVFGAFTAVETALADITNTRSFLNGYANLLGLDPNFLLLFPSTDSVTYNGTDGSGGVASKTQFDSFGQIVARLRGSNRPLTVALDKQADALNDYENFRESVDVVTQELKEQRVSFETRFREITGYDVGEEGWDGVTPKPGAGSELEQVALDLQLLENTKGKINQLIGQFGESKRKASATLANAEKLNSVVDTAEAEYVDAADKTYIMLGATRVASEASQTSTDLTYELAGVDGVTTFFTAGTNAGGIATAGATNIVVQTLAAGLETKFERDLDEAGKSYETALQHADNALVVSQSQDALQDLLREQYGADIEQQEVLNGITQAQAKQAALRLELTRIQLTFDTNTKAARSKYQADPIHFIRSQNAILDADAAFEEAQRWMFYAQRALEHKWTQRFAVVSGGNAYDGSSIFKMRNAEELEDLLTAYFNFDANREPGSAPSYVNSVISFKDHLLSKGPDILVDPDPNDNDDASDGDPRINLATGDTEAKITHFRNQLTAFKNDDGHIVIPFNTALLQDVDGLFSGPVYSKTTGDIVTDGKWRDKIHYIKFNIVATDGPIPGAGGSQPLKIKGNVSYGGLTFFRTRVVPCSSNRLTLPSGADQDLDIPGEFVVQPFRHYQSENLDNIFTVTDELNASPDFAYSGQSINKSFADPTREDTLGTSFRINDFKELSVAATRWELTITDPIVIDKITDIELLIRHQSFSRVRPANCPEP